LLDDLPRHTQGAALVVNAPIQFQPNIVRRVARHLLLLWGRWRSKSADGFVDGIGQFSEGFF
jgi:hypothetical protein